jgi:flagellar biosynthetic protein FliO
MTGLLKRAVLCASLLALVVPSAAGAQALDGGIGGDVVSLGIWDWLGLIARLVAVLGVIWAAFWGMRWYSRRTQTSGGARGELEILETRALGPNRSLQLVRVGRRAVLVGVTPERINQLLEIDDHEEVDRLLETLEAQRASSPSLGLRIGSMSRVALPSLAPLTSRRGRNRNRGVQPSMSASDALLGGQDYAPPAAAAQQLQASHAYRQARIEELQRAIEDARRGTSFERAN